MIAFLYYACRNILILLLFALIPIVHGKMKRRDSPRLIAKRIAKNDAKYGVAGTASTERKGTTMNVRCPIDWQTQFKIIRKCLLTAAVVFGIFSFYGTIWLFNETLNELIQTLDVMNERSEFIAYKLAAYNNGE